MSTTHDSRTGRDLKNLARFYGVQPSYLDAFGVRQTAAPEALISILNALGVPIAGASQAAAALIEGQKARDSEFTGPTAACWNGAGSVTIRPGGEDRVDCHLVLEDGSETTWTTEKGSWKAAPRTESTQLPAFRLNLPAGLAFGYHKLHLTAGKKTADVMIISSPGRAYSREGRRWGVFAPLYGLHSERSWGIGDFTDLGAFFEWIASLGGSFAGTLPLLAGFMEQPFEPSPYSPASRLFWNEVFIDVGAAPGLDDCQKARDLISSSRFTRRISKLREEPLVDYRGTMALKRQVLEELSGYFFEQPARPGDYEDFLTDNPSVQGYAAFRAEGDMRGSAWPQWQGTHTGSKAEFEQNRDYHLYVQWLCHQQLTRASRHGKGQTSGMYLDLPLGAHSASFDTWRWPHLFALKASAGAPPDPAFTTGQDWGLPPLNPRAIQAEGYSYQISCLRHLMRHAEALRIDHIMGMHRLFWVPQEMGASEGTYVKYPANDLYAVLTLESHRTKTVIIGEDLGTVPHYVRSKMARHGILGSHILEYEMLDSHGTGVDPPGPDALAALNTHDMYPFASFWEGMEAGKKGGLSGAGINPELGSQEAMKRAIELLAASKARLMLVNIEDLWSETEPQNVPGTSGEDQANWRRKLRYSLEEIEQMPEIKQLLEMVNGLVGHAGVPATRGMPGAG